MTRDRVVFAFWAFAAMTLVAWAVVLAVTFQELQASPSVVQLLKLVPGWIVCPAAIYVLWRLARFARQLPREPDPH